MRKAELADLIFSDEILDTYLPAWVYYDHRDEARCIGCAAYTVELSNPRRWKSDHDRDCPKLRYDELAGGKP